jgi:hypothetical protein
MRMTVSILARAAAMALAVGAILAAAAASAGASVPVDLRVVSSDAGNLADVRQYVPGTTTIKTYDGPDCFSAANHSSGQSYTLSAPTMLGAIWEAAQVEPALQPLRISDANYNDFGSFGVCQVNAKTPPGFFYLKANHQSLQVGANLFTVQGGEDLLAYRTPADFSTDEELDLSAPVRSAPGAPVTVNVRSYTSPFSSAGATVQPRQGATVLGADSTATTDAAGNAVVSFASPGVHSLTAVGDYNDIPSQTLTVCVNVNPEQTCPAERGREILGSDEAEGIKGTDGDDVIRPRGGKDGVKAGAGNDLIVANGGGRDRIFCGGGKDTVVRDRKDRVAKSCEIVRGHGKKKHKKKGKHKK